MIPTEVMDALTALQTAADASATAVTAEQGTAKALADAQGAENTAKAAVTATAADVKTKLDALIALLQKDYPAAAPQLTAALRGHFAGRMGPRGVAASSSWQSWLQLLLQILQAVEANNPPKP